MVEAEQLKTCSFFLVRYVPDIVRDEGLNIGLFLFSPQEDYLDCIFTDDLRRVRSFHPQADVDLLKDLPQHFEDEIRRRESGLADFVREMQESYSNMIQVTSPRTCLTADPQAEMQNLFARYVGTRKSGALASGHSHAHQAATYGRFPPARNPGSRGEAYSCRAMDGRR